MNTTSNRRVLLTVLSVRTSTKGTEYLSGYLAKAKVVAFKGEPDKYGQPTWNVYVSEPEGRPGTTLPDNLRQRQERASAAGGADADWDTRF